MKKVHFSQGTNYCEELPRQLVIWESSCKDVEEKKKACHYFGKLNVSKELEYKTGRHQPFTHYIKGIEEPPKDFYWLFLLSNNASSSVEMFKWSKHEENQTYFISYQQIIMWLDTCFITALPLTALQGCVGMRQAHPVLQKWTTPPTFHQNFLHLFSTIVNSSASSGFFRRIRFALVCRQFHPFVIHGCHFLLLALKKLSLVSHFKHVLFVFFF